MAKPIHDGNAVESLNTRDYDERKPLIECAFAKITLALIEGKTLKYFFRRIKQ